MENPLLRPPRPRPRPPRPRRELQTIYGCYHWNPDQTDYDAARDGNLLQWGQETVARIGMRMIRVGLSVRDIYLLGISPGSRLVEVATHPAYRRLFSDERLSDYLLTAYSRVCAEHQWADSLSAEEAAQVRTEFSGLARHLSSEYPQKRFVLLNWESDNAVVPFLRWSQSASQDMADWLSARIEGVRLAGAANVRCGVEIARILPGWNYYAWTEVIPRLSARADYLSLSAWDVFNPRRADEIGHDRWQQAQQIMGAGGWQAGEVLIGELGYYDRQDGAGMAAQRLAWALRELSGKVAYVTYWQARDSAPHDGDGLLTSTGDDSMKLQTLRETIGLSS